MRTWMLGVLAAAGLMAGCGGRSPVAYCNDFVSEVCAREFECQPPDTKSSASFIMMYGATQAECESMLKQATCVSVTNDKPCIDATQHYHSDKADACINDLKATSCPTIVMSGFVSDNCLSVCS